MILVTGIMGHIGFSTSIYFAKRNFEIQKLFFKKINQILNKKYIEKKQKKIGTFHYRNDLPIFVRKNWKLKIKQVLKKYRKE